MSCFICLEEDGHMMSQGCLCKGSISVHEPCFKEWCTNAVDPFTCGVCKTSLSLVLLAKYLGIEGVMFYSDNKEYYEQVVFNDFIWNHGFLVLIKDGQLIFDNERDMDLYMESSKREYNSQKKMVQVGKTRVARTCSRSARRFTRNVRNNKQHIQQKGTMGRK
jgi:hypothetical protein